VHAARVEEDGAGAAASALELACLSGRPPAVALCVVVDRRGAAAPLVDARQDPCLLARVGIACVALDRLERCLSQLANSPDSQDELVIS
jgi:hypothetical protein